MLKLLYDWAVSSTTFVWNATFLCMLLLGVLLAWDTTSFAGCSFTSASYLTLGVRCEVH
jgi:hypothetical protein